MNDDLTEQVCKLLATELDVEQARLGPTTRLAHDLGCDGEDARELLERYAAAFAVDLANFDPSRHFGPEAAFNPLMYLYWWLCRPERLRCVPLTIEDLVEGARRGVLLNPERTAV